MPGAPTVATGLSILIVEDEAIIAADLANQLRQLGYGVVGTADNSTTALEMVRERRPGVVLMDIQLAGPIDGKETARVIFEQYGLPVVFVTAHSDRATVVQAMASQPYGYVLKPINERELVVQIELARYKHRAEQRLRDQREQFRIVADFTHDWEYWRTPESQFRYVSPSCERMTGYAAEAFIRDPELYLRIVHRDDRERVARHLVEDLEHGDRCELEFRIVCRDGRERWIGHVCQPVYGSGGEFLGRRASNRDIGTQKQAMFELERAHAELEQRVEERTQELRSAVASLEGEIRSRNEIESALRESEERYRTLFAGAPVGLAITDPTGRVRDANAAICAMMRVSLETAKAANAKDFYAESSQRRQLLYQLRLRGRVVDTEVKLQRSDGTFFDASILITQAMLRGEVVLLTFVTDQTRRKQAERHLSGISALHKLFLLKRSRAEYLRSVLRLLRHWSGATGCGIRLLDGSGGLPFLASSGLPRAFLRQERGLVVDSFDCPCLRAMRSAIGASGRPARGAKGAMLCQSMPAESAQAEAMPCQTSGYASLVHAPIRHGSEVIGAIMLAHREAGFFSPEVLAFLQSTADLLGEALHRFRVEADLRDSELRFRMLFERHEAIMLLVDPRSGAIVDANRAAESFYGYSREQLTAMTVDDMSLQPWSGGREGRRRSGRGVDGVFQTSQRLANGETRIVEVHSSRINVQEGSLSFAIVHDITERRQLEREVLDAGDRERQRVGIDLHDSLGGSLSGLALLSKALSQGLEKQASDQVDLAEELVQGISEAIGRTRAIARGLCPVGLSTLGLVNSLGDLASHIQKRAGIQCRVVARGEVVLADNLIASYLFQIAEEAVSNSIRHARCSRIVIKLLQDKGALCLEVRDNGIGISEEPAAVSLGIGLRTMRHRAEVIGARFSAGKHKSGGTLVSCCLPSDAVQPMQSP